MTAAGVRTVFNVCPPRDLSVCRRPCLVMTELRRPTERTCLNCGRNEVWDGDAVNWVVGSDVGEVYCLHVWDITGEFSPVTG